jgi:hypothetical protein
MAEISMIGLDLAKNVFQIQGIDAASTVVLRRQVRRGQVEKSARRAFHRPLRADRSGRGKEAAQR